jgi:hypothetical protein
VRVIGSAKGAVRSVIVPIPALVAPGIVGRFVNLTGFRKGTFVLSISAKTSDGRSVTGTRTYHTCVAKRTSHYGAPRL